MIEHESPLVMGKNCVTLVINAEQQLAFGVQSDAGDVRAVGEWQSV